MTYKHFEQKLLEKRRELQARIASFESEARAAGEAEVRDPLDGATTSQSTAEIFEEATLATQTLGLVEAALRRIEDGTYGRCILGDRDIEPARLEAIPWAEYCLEDQEKEDKRNRAAVGGPGL